VHGKGKETDVAAINVWHNENSDEFFSMQINARSLLLEMFKESLARITA